jgi:hypothetical protein
MRCFQKLGQFVRNYQIAIAAWVIILMVIQFGLYYDIDRSIVALVALMVGLLGEAFAALITWIAVIPIVGPLAAKALSLPFLWILNGIGYLATIVAIKRGYPREVLNYRVLTITLLVGITIGYVVGKLI